MPRPGPRVPCQKTAEQLQQITEKEKEIKQALLRCSKDKKTKCRHRRHSEQVALSVMCQIGGSRTLTLTFLQRDLGEQGPKAVADTLASVAATYEGVI